MPGPASHRAGRAPGRGPSRGVWNDLDVGRSVEECLRTLDALQFVERHGEVCPANWKPGLPGIRVEASEPRPVRAGRGAGH